MAIDFNKPVKTDNYDTGMLSAIRAHVLALAMWLEPTDSGTHTNLVANLRRFNKSSGLFEYYNGSAWLEQSVAYAKSASPVFTGTVGIPIGSAGSPSLYFSGDTNTGIFSPTGDVFALSTGGSERMRITGAGNVGIGTTAPITTLSGRSLEVRDDANPPTLLLNRRTNTASVHTGGVIAFGAYRDIRDPSIGAAIWASHTAAAGNTTTLNFAAQTNGDNNALPTWQFLLNGSGHASFNVPVYVKDAAAGVQGGITAAVGDVFTHDGKSISHYGLQWANLSYQTAGSSAILSAYGDVEIWVQGSRALRAIGGSALVDVVSAVRAAPNSGSNAGAAVLRGTATASRSGYVEFFGQNGVRQGYIGFSNTESGSTEGGTINFAMASAAFSGSATFSSITVGGGTGTVSGRASLVADGALTERSPYTTGTYCIAVHATVSTAIVAGNTYAGSSLRPVRLIVGTASDNVSFHGTGNLSGNWKAMGDASVSTSNYVGTLFMRTS